MDVSSYMDVFLIESREHLQNLNQSLLDLESNPHKSSVLGELFRSSHTLKGMAATMGFNQIAHLTHEMENVLSDLRAQKIRVTEEVVDVLFQCLDSLSQMVDSIELGKGGEMPVDQIVVRLVNLGNENQPATPGEPARVEIVEESSSDFNINQYDSTLIQQAQNQELNVFHVVVEVDEGSLMKSVRAYMVFKNLEEMGEIFKSLPSAQELEEGSFDQRFEVLFISKSEQEAVVKAINQISEVKVVSCECFEPAAVEVSAASEAAHRMVEAAAEDAGAAGTVRSTGKVRQTVRVDIERLDNLMNLVGELVINKTRLEQIGSTQNLFELNETVEQFARISTDLQNVVMKVRMVPVEQVFNRFPRMVRDLAKDLGKEINFVMEGKETELDRTVIDEIGDPLVHLLRNSIDHGIEMPEVRESNGKPREGTVKLIARHEGNSVVIEVIDDGRGIDVEKNRKRGLELGWISEDRYDEYELINLIFKPGFSTAETVTDLSGRGVGLDAVKAKIESLSGTVMVENQPGAGTCFRIRLPLTLAIIQALLVKVGNEIYAIPLSSVDETTIVYRQNIRKVQSQEVVVLRGQVLPLLKLGQQLGANGMVEDNEKDLFVVVVRKANRRIGLVVDSLIGQQEIVIKSLGRLMASIPGLAGATILGDGDVSLILDVGTLF
ncbi:MAG: chemotaxis protein CheA [Firmicutes bacterium]|nr:chemotaxis protein CheA [Bacillota bacterium]